MSNINDFLKVCLEIDNPDNSITWQAIDLDTFQGSGKFRMYNMYTGEHELFANLELTKQRADELKNMLLAATSVNPPPPEEDPFFRDHPIPIDDDTLDDKSIPEVKTI